MGVAIPVILTYLFQRGVGALIDRHAAKIAAENDKAKMAEFMQGLPGMIQQIQAGTQMVAQEAGQEGAQQKGIPEVPSTDLPEPSFAQVPPTPAQEVQKPFRFLENITPDDINIQEEPVSLTRPQRFHKPLQLSGVSVDPQNRTVKFSMKPDQAAMDAQFGTAYKDYLDKARAGGTAGLSEAEMRDNLFWNLVGEFGFFPSDEIAKTLLPEWEDRQEQAYFRVAEALRRNAEFRDGIKAATPGLSNDTEERLIQYNAYTAAAERMNGYMPEDIREQFAGMQLPSLKPETEEVLAERGVSPMMAGGEQIGAAREQLRTEEVMQAAAKKGAQIGTEFAMREIEPITGKDRAKHGVGVGFKTYTDLANAGMRFPTEVERKDYLDLSDVTNMIDSVNQLVERVFSSSDNYASRVAHGVQIRASMASGGELGLDAKEYDRQLGVMGRKMLSLVERGGRFTNQDMEQILKTLPKLNLLAPDGSKLAKRLIERARVIASKKLESYRSVLIKPTGQPRAAELALEPSASPQTGDWIIDEKGDLKKVK